MEHERALGPGGIPLIMSPQEVADARNGSASQRKLANLHAALEGAGFHILGLRTQAEMAEANRLQLVGHLNTAQRVAAVVIAEACGGSYVLSAEVARHALRGGYFIKIEPQKDGTVAVEAHRVELKEEPNPDGPAPDASEGERGSGVDGEVAAAPGTTAEPGGPDGAVPLEAGGGGDRADSPAEG